MLRVGRKIMNKMRVNVLQLVPILSAYTLSLLKSEERASNVFTLG